MIKYYEEDLDQLKRQLLIFQNEIARFQSVPLIVGQLMEKIDKNSCIIGSTTGNNYLVKIISTIDRNKLKPNSSVALHRNSNALVNCLEDEADSGNCRPLGRWHDLGNGSGFAIAAHLSSCAFPIGS